MKILQFKLGGEYSYNVTFETVDEKRRIQTNEHPKGDLLNDISSVVAAAVQFFRFESIAASFRQVSFSYPEKGCETFILELTIKTKENVYVKHTLKTEKLELRQDDTESTDAEYGLRITQGNTLVSKILKLREEIEAYAKGARMQEDLPFENEDDDDEEGGELFTGDELDISEGTN